MKRGIGLVVALLLVIAAIVVWRTYFQKKGEEDVLLLSGNMEVTETNVGFKLPGRVVELAVDEGQQVQAGQLVATIESQDLKAAQLAAAATAESQRYKLQVSKDTARQTNGSTASQVSNAEAQLRAARATLVQAQAQYEHQDADSRRAVALAQQGVMSAQALDDAKTSLDAARAAVDAAKEQVAAAEASLKLAIANTIQAQAAEQSAEASKADVESARAMLKQAQVEAGYASVVSPVTGIVDVRAARQGEVVNPGSPIVTIVDLTQTWVYAPLPETQSDSVQVGDVLRVVMPSGASLNGKVIAKSAEGDFATQRDVSRRKRDIKTVRLKLLIENPGMRYVPGMTAEVYIPKNKLVQQ